MVDKFNIDRTIARFAGILELGTILGACANDQKRVVQEFADGLNVGMHISRVQEIAKANKSIYLMEGHIGIESVRYYCREQYCVPKNLLELLHPRVEEGRNSQDFSVAEPSLDFKHYRSEEHTSELQSQF